MCTIGRFAAKKPFQAAQQGGAYRVNIAAGGVLVVGVGCQCFDDGKVLLPPGLQRAHELVVALNDSGMSLHMVCNGALVLQGWGKVGVGHGWVPDCAGMIGSWVGFPRLKAALA